MSGYRVFALGVIVVASPVVSLGTICVDPWNEFAVAVEGGRQSEPSIWGNWVAWSDYDEPGDLGSVYAKNILTQEMIRLSGADGGSDPDIYEGLVVWSQWNGGDSDIYAYDLSARSEFALYEGPGNQIWPAMYGDTVVWGHLNGQAGLPEEVWAYSTAHGTRVISSSPGAKWYPDVSGDIAVWGSFHDDSWDIYGFDLTTLTEFEIASGDAYQRSAAVFGDIVAYEVAHLGIGIYDVTTGQRMVHETSGEFDWVAMYGDIVVWGERRGIEGGYDIYGYNIAEDVEFPISIAKDDQMVPAIYEDTVVWADNRLGGYWHGDIYGNTIIPEPMTLMLLSPGSLVLIHRRRWVS